MAKKTKVTEDGEIILADEMIMENEYQPFFKTPFNHNTHKEALASATYFTEPSLAQQHTRDEVDINHILAKFGVGEVSQAGWGKFMDVPEDLDLRTSIAKIQAADNEWHKIPENIRQHFETMDNYLDFVQQAQRRNDRDSLSQLGLIDLPPPPAPS